MTRLVSRGIYIGRVHGWTAFDLEEGRKSIAGWRERLGWREREREKQTWRMDRRGRDGWASLQGQSTPAVPSLSIRNIGGQEGSPVLSRRMREPCRIQLIPFLSPMSVIRAPMRVGMDGLLFGLYPRGVAVGAPVHRYLYSITPGAPGWHQGSPDPPIVVQPQLHNHPSPPAGGVLASKVFLLDASSLARGQLVVLLLTMYSYSRHRPRGRSGWLCPGRPS